MMPFAQSRKVTLTHEQEAALASIEVVMGLCRSAESDPAIDYELQELAAIRAAVQQEWPLPAALKQQISLGPFAAKNIADWDTELANALMSLDYALQHDISLAEIKRPIKMANDRVRPGNARSA
jgi:hypothetical protein